MKDYGKFISNLLKTQNTFSNMQTLNNAQLIYYVKDHTYDFLTGKLCYTINGRQLGRDRCAVQ